MVTMTMSVHEARDRVIRTALRALQAQQAEPCRYSDAEIEHTDGQLALAAHDLTEATEAAEVKPVGVVTVNTNKTRQCVTISCETAALTTLPDALLDDEISPMSKMAYWYLKRHGGLTSVKDLADAMENRSDVMWRCLSDLDRHGWISTADYAAYFVDDGAPIQFTVHEVPAAKR